MGQRFTGRTWVPRTAYGRFTVFCRSVASALVRSNAESIMPSRQHTAKLTSDFLCHPLPPKYNVVPRVPSDILF